MTLGVRCVAVNAEGEICLIRHTYAEGWSFPGGGVDPGETMFDAAERELREETGQQLDKQSFCGVMKFRLQPDERTEFGALYAGKLEKPSPFTINEEAEQIRFWDLKENIGYVNEIDHKLIDYFV